MYSDLLIIHLVMISSMYYDLVATSMATRSAMLIIWVGLDIIISSEYFNVLHCYP